MSPEEAEKKSAKKAETKPPEARGAKEKPVEPKKMPPAGGPQEKKDGKPEPGKSLTKKTRPTNCAFSNVRIRRKDWYYRNGMYFANKNAYKEYMKKELEEAGKKTGEAAQAAGEVEAKKAQAPKKSEGSGEKPAEN